MINIFCEVKPEFNFHYKELAKKVISYVLEYKNFPYEAEVNLTLTDNASIHEINKMTREVDAPTDVLSFPTLFYNEAGDFSDIERQINDSVNPETGELILGDIILSVEKVISQATEYGHDRKREYAFLIVHSMLHLLGYDHMEKQDAEIMEQEQQHIMNGLNIHR